jgi:hypothetical protein
MKAKKTRFLVTSLVLLGSVASSSAATIYADAKDASVRYDSKSTELLTDDTIIIDDNDATDQIGRAGTNAAVRRTLVFAFQLPNLGAVADPFQTASFSFQLVNAQGINNSEDVDLYGLTARSTPDALVSDYFMGTNSFTTTSPFTNPGTNNPANTDDLAEGRTKLQDNILSGQYGLPSTGGSLALTITTDVTGSTGLLNYLNAQYAGGTGIGQYAILRLSMDQIPSAGDRYTVSMRDGANAANGGLGNLSIAPQITFTAVPEPSAALLGGFGLLPLLRRRR